MRYKLTKKGLFTRQTSKPNAKSRVSNRTSKRTLKGEISLQFCWKKCVLKSSIKAEMYFAAVIDRSRIQTTDISTFTQKEPYT
jgi:hypothetical protein